MRNGVTKDPQYMYGTNSTVNQGAHWRARQEMIKSSMNRNKSLMLHHNVSGDNGYLNLGKGGSQIKLKKEFIRPNASDVNSLINLRPTENITINRKRRRLNRTKPIVLREERSALGS